MQEEVRRLESNGVDAYRIEVESDMQGTAAETQHTAGQAVKPLGRALAGLLAGIVVGVALGAAVAAIADFQMAIGIMVGGISGALLGGLNALYSRLPMSSKAYNADGSRHAHVSVRD